MRVLSAALLICVAAQAAVLESPRKIPVLWDVDVVVIGGSTGAVSAALAAQAKGAKVFLAAPRPYLGEDMAAKMRLWLEEGETPRTPLARTLFDDPLTGRGGLARPLHVKKTLDDVLLKAGIEFLYGTAVTDVLRDASGQLAGVVVANRSGRQAVLARTVIDATERATVARLAGAKFAPYPTGPRMFRRYVLNNVANRGPGIESRDLRIAFPVDETPDADRVGVIEYKVTVPMEGGSFASFAEAEQLVRDLTNRDDDIALTEEIFEIPPDPVQGSGPDIGAFRPAGIPRLYVLGGCADLPRDEAEALMRPLALMDAGGRIGTAAADEARRVPRIRQARVSAGLEGSIDRGEVRELFSEDRPRFAGAPTVESPARALPILGTYDVVVVGGGTGGAPAGIGAARRRARTLVVEYLAGLGGQGTQGRVNRYYWGNRGGFTGEVPVTGRGWDPIQKAEWWRRSLREAGGDLWFGSMGAGALVRDGRVTGVVVVTPAGRGVVLAKTVIDSTGNADVAAPAGAMTMDTDASEFAHQGAGVAAISLKPGGSNTDFTIVDESDIRDVWHVFVYAKDKHASRFDLGQLIASRERRRIVGDFEMTILDQVNERKYPDTISTAYSNFDTHGYTTDPYFLLEHPDKEGIPVNIPLRCLLPKGLEGMLVTGLGISVHRDAVPLTRMQADIQNQGFAAGTIAAIADGRALRSLDVRSLQRELVKLGIVPERVLEEGDSHPLPPERIAEAVETVKDEFEGAAVLLAHPEQALPLLRSAYANASGDDKMTYALVLGVMGDRTGADTLLAGLEQRPWDKGWDYSWERIGTQFGRAVSEVDTLILALGRAGDPRAVDAILKKLPELDASSAFSHHRAVALALERFADPRAAKPLADLLAKPGMTGHVNSTVELARERNGLRTSQSADRAVALRELNLARALYRCGDYNGLARKLLESFKTDLRGHFARHAAAVLQAKEVQR
ncbi:MAG: FAD-dependent oxidoreductase [Bryobacterales bacterium]|nr:FAD-dependent oxidoreductase [Bryobacterales bacterium]